MLTLKIMSEENRADCEPDKDYIIIGDIREIKFHRTHATDYERNLLGLRDAPEGEVWSVAVAECSFPGTGILSTYLLSGNCFVMNDQGQTAGTYWACNKVGLAPADAK